MKDAAIPWRDQPETALGRGDNWYLPGVASPGTSQRKVVDQPDESPVRAPLCEGGSSEFDDKSPATTALSDPDGPG